LLCAEAFSYAQPANSAGGFNLPVRITVGDAGQTAVQPFMSYVGPTITPHTLRKNCAGAPTNVTLSGAEGGDSICFTGTNYVPGSTSIWFTGPTVGSNLFVCPPTSVTTTAITCTAPEGMGQNLQIFVKVGTITSLPSVETVSYPTPLVLPNTIRAGIDDSKLIYSTSFLTQSTQGSLIAFNVRYVPHSFALWSDFLSVSRLSIDRAP
jgi:hypothetical protein